MTYLGDGWLAFGIILFLFFISFIPYFNSYNKNLFRKQAKILFLYLILGGVLVRILKILIGRSRPHFFLESGIKFDPLSLDYLFNSFPSGHTQTVTTLMLCLAFFYSQYRYLFFLLILIGAISRVMLLVHYPSDILIGFYIGLIFYFLARLSYQKQI